MGTSVVRHRSVPARPAELDGEVVILVEKGGGLDGASAEAELRSALGAFENPRYEEGRWRVRFATYAAAEEAVEAATAAGALPGATAVFLFHEAALLQAADYEDVHHVLLDATELKVVPLLQAFLFDLQRLREG